MLEPIKHYSIENPACIYDEEALTVLELVGRTAQKCNEVVNAQNKLDKTITQRMDEFEDGYKETIHNLVVNTIPTTVTNEVLTQMGNGTLDPVIESCVEEFIASLDGVENVYLPIVFDTYKGYYIRNDTMSFSQNDSGVFNLSNPIPLPPGIKQVKLHTDTANTWINKLTFAKDDQMSKSSLISGFVADSAGDYTVDVPEGTRYVYVQDEDDNTGATYDGKVLVYIPSGELYTLMAEMLINYQTFKNQELEDGERVYPGIVFDTYKGYYINRDPLSWATNANLNLSNPIPIPVGVTKVYGYAKCGNGGINKLTFAKDDQYSMASLISGIRAEEVGPYSAIVPEGAKFMYVAEDIDSAFTNYGGAKVWFDKAEVVDIVAKLTHGSQGGESGEVETVKLDLPERILCRAYPEMHTNFTIRFENILVCSNPDDYTVTLTVPEGTYIHGVMYAVYRDRVEFETINDGMNSDTVTTVTFHVWNKEGVEVATRDMDLDFINDYTVYNPDDAPYVLCIGDSLTTGYQNWVRSLKDNDKNLGHIILVGKNGSTGYKYDAVGGRSIMSISDPGGVFGDSLGDAVSVTEYVNNYCSGHLDWCVIFLGWNDSGWIKNKDQAKNVWRGAIETIHNEYPHCNILLVGLHAPTPEACITNHWNYLEKKGYVHMLNEALAELAESESYVYFAHISSLFDSQTHIGGEDFLIDNGIHYSDNGHKDMGQYIGAYLAQRMGFNYV